jgi:hypothetical protein
MLMVCTNLGRKHENTSNPFLNVHIRIYQLNMLHFATLTVVACSSNMNRLDMVALGAGGRKKPR